MSPKTVFNWPLFSVSLVGIALSAVAIFLLTSDMPKEGAAKVSSSSTSNETTFIPEPVQPGLPIRLTIPTLKIDAAIELVSLTPQGAMDVPSGPTTVGWYSAGPRPGAIGSAVIDGHYGWKNGLPSVFDNVHKLQPGDTLSVVDDRGETSLFMVRELQTYSQHENVPGVFVSTDGKSHLNLITCQGVWNTAKQSFPYRLVVYTDKVS